MYGFGCKDFAEETRRKVLNRQSHSVLKPIIMRDCFSLLNCYCITFYCKESGHPLKHDIKEKSGMRIGAGYDNKRN